MPWIPVSQKHAIERVRIAGTFSNPLPPKFIRRLGNDFEGVTRSLGFGPMQTVQSQELIFDAASPSGPRIQPQPQTIIGWQVLRLANSGTPIEVFSIDTNNFFYEAAEYGRWETFRDRYRQVSQAVLERTNEVSDFRAFALEYFDRFVAMGTPAPKVADLFKGVPDVLAPSASQDGALWHLHRGWFETIGGRNVLVQQNLDAGDGMFNGTPARSVGIMSRAEQRSEPQAIEFSDLLTYLEQMHDRLNGLLSQTLTDEAQKSIGLEV